MRGTGFWKGIDGWGESSEIRRRILRNVHWKTVPFPRPPVRGIRDFFRAILTRRRSPGSILRLRFHPRVSRRSLER